MPGPSYGRHDATRKDAWCEHPRFRRFPASRGLPGRWSLVGEYFDLFQRSPLLGLLDLDLLLTIDYLAMIPFYLALFVVVRRVSATSALIALVFGLFSVALFLFSREATFSMWLLSNQHASERLREQRKRPAPRQ